MSAVEGTSALRDLVIASTLVPDLRRPLTVKLDDVLKALAAGKTKTACNSLDAFSNQVKAQRGKAIPTATANVWLAKVTIIRNSAGC
jgi:hypothetical protein